MSKQTILAFGVTVLLIVALYGWGRTVPLHKKGAAEQQQSAMTDDGVMAAARARLDSTKGQWLAELERQRAQAAASDINQEIEVLKLLSRTWNEWENFGVGGLYAEQVASLRPNDAEAWAIAGSTYGIAFNREKMEAMDLRQWAAKKAVQCFRQAATIQPDTVRYAINEAVMLLDLSSVDASVMPMEGVNKLRDLDKRFPKNVAVNMTMGRLSLMRSGDVAKAIPRFENVLTWYNEDTAAVELELVIEAHFSLADCYTQQQQRDKVLYHYDQCIALAPNPQFRKEVEARKKAYEQEKK